MLIDSTSLIQVLDHNDGLVPVATLSGPVGDLTIQGPSGVVNIPSVISLAGGGSFSGTFAGSPTFTWTPTWSGHQNFANGADIAGGAFSGTFSGPHTYSGNVTFSGTSGNPVTIGSSTFSAVPMQINGQATASRQIRYQTAGSTRWAIGTSTEAESGNNVGCNLGFTPFTDAGSNSGLGVTFNRASAGISQTSTVALSSNTSNTAVTSGLFLSQTFNGTSNVSAGAVLNQLTVTDNLTFTGASNGIQALNVQINYGTGIGGGRTALNAVSNQTAGPTGGTDSAFNGVGGAFDARANFTVGGTAPKIGSAKGFVFGINPAAHLLGTATNFVSPIGMEINVVAGTGTSCVRKVGIQIVGLANDAVSGSNGVDAGLLMFGNNGGAAYDYGILLGDEQGTSLVGSSGTLIGTRIFGGPSIAVGTVGWGIDFLPTIAANGLIRGNGFMVDGSGNTYVGLGAIKPDSAGMAIDTVVKQAVSATIATAGTGFTASQDMNDDQGNIWAITIVAGSATAATLKRAAQTTTGPATTTIQPQWFQPNGTGITLNVTYNSGTTLKLQPSGGSIQGGSGAWTANGSVATALSSVGPTGSHTTVQEWFTVKNASGTVRYIPAF